MVDPIRNCFNCLPIARAALIKNKLIERSRIRLVDFALLDCRNEDAPLLRRVNPVLVSTFLVHVTLEICARHKFGGQAQIPTVAWTKHHHRKWILRFR
ncbi:MAG: hypothetical protein ACR2QJ_12790 [Geminicoccaceae bacterium]